MENLKRYIITSQYNLQTDLLTIEVRDSVRGRSKSSVRKLNRLSRKSVESDLYKSLGCDNLIFERAMEEIKASITNINFPSYFFSFFFSFSNSLSINGPVTFTN